MGSTASCRAVRSLEQRESRSLDTCQKCRLSGCPLNPELHPKHSRNSATCAADRDATPLRTASQTQLGYVQVGEIPLEKYRACVHPRTQDNGPIVLRCSQDNSSLLGVSTV